MPMNSESDGVNAGSLKNAKLPACAKAERRHLRAAVLGFSVC
jgi:hypothetical protein